MLSSSQHHFSTTMPAWTLSMLAPRQMNGVRARGSVLTPNTISTPSVRGALTSRWLLISWSHCSKEASTTALAEAMATRRPPNLPSRLRSASRAREMHSILCPNAGVPFCVTAIIAASPPVAMMRSPTCGVSSRSRARTFSTASLRAGLPRRSSPPLCQIRTVLLTTSLSPMSKLCRILSWTSLSLVPNGSSSTGLFLRFEYGDARAALAAIRATKAREHRYGLCTRA
mmetsp:Transcript_59858/g.165605  ORF Transcript_59858/g.165605 Transcript_59858/m.165605 type:complete len:228 (+) Transcript_59858:1745-2428(+)